MITSTNKEAYPNTLIVILGHDEGRSSFEEKEDVTRVTNDEGQTIGYNFFISTSNHAFLFSSISQVIVKSFPLHLQFYGPYLLVYQFLCHLGRQQMKEFP